MPTVIAQGNLLTDGTEQTATSFTDPGIYEVEFNLSNMVAASGVTFRTKQAVLSGGTKQTSIEEAFAAAQSDPDNQIKTIPLWCPQGLDFTIERTAGGDQTYEFSISRVANLTVEASGTHALDGSEQILGTITTNKVVGLLSDHDLQVGGDTVILRVDTKVRASSALTELYRATLTGVLVAPDIIQQSIAIPAPHSVSFSMEKTGGANHNVPFALCSVAE